MIRIALVDQSEDSLKREELMIRDYAKANPELGINLICYRSGIELLHEVERGVPFKVFFLEVEMPGISGIDVAKTLDEIGISSSVIFMSREVKYAVEAFDLNATHYLLKDISPEKMVEALNRACILSGREHRRQLMFKLRDGVRYIFVRDVMYSIGQQKIQQIYLQNGEKLEVRITGKELAESLTSFGNFFVRCGSSYLVNFFFVSSMTSDTIEMTDGTLIPIPRRMRTEMAKAFEAFEEQFNRRK